MTMDFLTAIARPSRRAEPCEPCAAFSNGRSMAVAAGIHPGFPLFAEMTRIGIMTGLGALAGLAAMSGVPPRGPDAPVPDGARVVRFRHESRAGARDVRLFVPSERRGGYRGLVVMLHGCTQNAEDFALGTQMDFAAERAGFVVAYPEQTSMANVKSCWNWFHPDNQDRMGGEPEIIGMLALSLADQFGLEGRVHAAGLSAGGAMAAILAETWGDVFCSVGIHSGLGAGAAHDGSSAFAAMRGESETARALACPAIVFQGETDTTVAAANAEALVPPGGRIYRHSGEDGTWTRRLARNGSELWSVEGGAHTWFGGDPRGSHTVAWGPDASAEMLRFFAGRHGRA